MICNTSCTQEYKSAQLVEIGYLVNTVNCYESIIYHGWLTRSYRSILLIDAWQFGSITQHLWRNQRKHHAMSLIACSKPKISLHEQLDKRVLITLLPAINFQIQTATIGKMRTTKLVELPHWRGILLLWRGCLSPKRIEQHGSRNGQEQTNWFKVKSLMRSMSSTNGDGLLN